jgi:hypothetical protein
VREGHEFLRRKIPVNELVAEEHRDNRPHGEGVENPRLFRRIEAEAGQIAEDQRELCAPDRDLEDHHDEQLVADGLFHELWWSVDSEFGRGL